MLQRLDLDLDFLAKLLGEASFLAFQLMQVYRVRVSPQDVEINGFEEE